MDTEEVVVKLPATRKYRRHSEEFRKRIIESCLQPGVSVSAIAVANQLNTNMVRTWVKEYRELRGYPPLSRRPEREPDEPAPMMVPIQIREAGTDAGIRVSVRMADREIEVNWPIADARTCIQWLREVLR
jgi:transposase-like protein